MLLNFYPLFKSFKHLIFQQLQLVLYLSAKSSLEKVRLVKISYPSFHAQIICLSCNGYEKRVLAHFENNLDFKATHEFFLDFKSTWNQPWLKKNSSDTFSKQPWFQGNLNFSQVHNVSFAGSGAFRVPQRICKVNTIKLVCCNRQFFYLVSDASKPDWRK